jgi:hypothetical protein
LRAPEQASFEGAGPPLQVLPQGPPGQVTQEIVAAQPEEVIEPSEVNWMVRQPLVAVRLPGFVVPDQVPSKGGGGSGTVVYAYKIESAFGVEGREGKTNALPGCARAKGHRVVLVIVVVGSGACSVSATVVKVSAASGHGGIAHVVILGNQGCREQEWN